MSAGAAAAGDDRNAAGGSAFKDQAGIACGPGLFVVKKCQGFHPVIQVKYRQVPGRAEMRLDLRVTGIVGGNDEDIGRHPRRRIPGERNQRAFDIIRRA